MGDVKIRCTPCIVLPTREYRLPVAYFCLCWCHQPLYLQVLIKMICTSRRNISRNVKSSMFFSLIFFTWLWIEISCPHSCCVYLCLGGKFLKKTAKEAPSDFCQKQHLYIFTCIYMYIHVYTYMCNYVRVFQFNHFYNTIFSCKNKIKDTWVNIGSFRFPYVFPPSKGCLVWRWCTH